MTANLYSMINNIFSEEVKVGNLIIGGKNRIIVQSMTNVPTTDISNSVVQCKKIFDAGADMVRISTPRPIDVVNLSEIKKILIADGYLNPLVADVHFSPKIAENAARIVEKVRINPGNYIDKRANFKPIKFTDDEYKLELEKIHENLLPLIKICKKYGTAIRIGSNHGSLSDRILSRFGNTTEGMVEAAMEFIQIFMSENFKNLVISMKASDTKIMIDACRLLNKKMMENGYIFPQHLGVTEAGAGSDARIKSAIGISTLLNEGIGDTIRISLTEPPENEIIFANKLLSFAKEKNSYPCITHNYIPIDKKDFVCISDNINYKSDITITNKNCSEFQLFKFQDLNSEKDFIVYEKTKFLVLESTAEPLKEVLIAKDYFKTKNISLPIILKYKAKSLEKDKIISEICYLLANLVTDRLISGYWIDCDDNEINPSKLAYDIMQATKIRTSKAEFISCPGCGRTNYNLEELAENMKDEFSHLKGLKIATMGCIVNGPGEMSDADYGCVGSMKDKVHIYKGKTIVMKNIPQELAIKALKQVIKDNNDWKEK